MAALLMRSISDDVRYSRSRTSLYLRVLVTFEFLVLGVGVLQSSKLLILLIWLYITFEIIVESGKALYGGEDC